jgi:hypothetical protein
LKKCLKDKYNECVVNAELAAHNDARLARKDTPAMTHDAAASVKIQEMLNDEKANYAATSPLPNLAAKAGDTFKNCYQSVWAGPYTKPGLGTEKWLAGDPAKVSDTKAELKALA